jgi:hypothetical protein
MNYLAFIAKLLGKPGFLEPVEGSFFDKPGRGCYQSILVLCQTKKIEFGGCAFARKSTGMRYHHQV